LLISGVDDSSASISRLFVGFILEHPLHHAFAVIFERNHSEADQKQQRDKDQNDCTDCADFKIAQRDSQKEKEWDVHSVASDLPSLGTDPRTINIFSSGMGCFPDSIDRIQFNIEFRTYFLKIALVLLLECH
tara:strand:- start:50 stop:445 length:396 start_codon:yes stop_codon:yes gene_type:complete